MTELNAELARRPIVEYTRRLAESAAAAAHAIRGTGQTLQWRATDVADDRGRGSSNGVRTGRRGSPARGRPT